MRRTVNWTSANVTITGNYVRYCEFGILVYYDTSDVPKCVNVLGNSVQDTSVVAIRVSGTSPYSLEHVNVDDNVVNGFSTGIFISDCRRGSCANNQLTGGTGTGINLSAGIGNYDIKVVACDVETTGQYCYHVGHQRNSLVGCSGRNASTAIFYVTGAHNHVVSCETEAAFNADILRVEGNSHNIHGNDFSYTVSPGYYSVNLTRAADRVFVHGNRLYQPGNFGTNSMIYDNVVNDVYKASGF
ncbi:MAG: NosD domain-containing protein [Planctomycetota bacterium]